MSGAEENKLGRDTIASQQARIAELEMREHPMSVEITQLEESIAQLVRDRDEWKKAAQNHYQILLQQEEALRLHGINNLPPLEELQSQLGIAQASNRLACEQRDKAYQRIKELEGERKWINQNLSTITAALNAALERIAKLEAWARDVVDTIEDTRHRHRGEALLEKG